MNRFISLAFLLLTLCFSACKNKLPKTEQKPNIIFLLTDDQRWDALGAMGNPWIKTPVLDSLALKGTLFKNAYVTTAICCTSRASLLSGQYARRHGIHDFRTPFSDSALHLTYPLILKKAGYRTAFIGKYGIGNEKSLPKEYFDYWNAMAGQPRYEQTDEEGNYLHYTQKLGKDIEEFLQTCSKEQAFSLSVSFKAPHVQDGDPRQFIYDTAYSAMYADIEFPLPATADTMYWEQYPDFFTQNNEARVRWALRFANPAMYQESMRGYYRLISGVDHVVGKMMAKLSQLGLDENTVILFMGDNGFYLGEHGMAGKWYGHEPSIRVPLFVYDPRNIPQQASTIEEIALNIDVAPTILDFAGLSIPASMQGRSLKPFTEGKVEENWRKEFFYEHLFEHPRIPKSEGVVSLETKYLIYPEQEEKYEELYNLITDPDEIKNLSGDSTYHKMLDEQREKLAHYREILP